MEESFAVFHPVEIRSELFDRQGKVQRPSMIARLVLAIDHDVYAVGDVFGECHADMVE